MRRTSSGRHRGATCAHERIAAGPVRRHQPPLAVRRRVDARPGPEPRDPRARRSPPGGADRAPRNNWCTCTTAPRCPRPDRTFREPVGIGERLARERRRCRRPPQRARTPLVRNCGCRPATTMGVGWPAARTARADARDGREIAPERAAPHPSSSSACIRSRSARCRDRPRHRLWAAAHRRICRRATSEMKSIPCAAERAGEEFRIRQRSTRRQCIPPPESARPRRSSPPVARAHGGQHLERQPRAILAGAAIAVRSGIGRRQKRGHAYRRAHSAARRRRSPLRGRGRPHERTELGQRPRQRRQCAARSVSVTRSRAPERSASSSRALSTSASSLESSGREPRTHLGVGAHPACRARGGAAAVIARNRSKYFAASGRLRIERKSMS